MKTEQSKRKATIMQNLFIETFVKWVRQKSLSTLANIYYIFLIKLHFSNYFKCSHTKKKKKLQHHVQEGPIFISSNIYEKKIFNHTSSSYLIINQRNINIIYIYNYKYFMDLALISSCIMPINKVQLRVIWMQIHIIGVF